MQSYFLDEKSHAFVPTGKAVLSNVQNLISHFRDHSRPVIFTRFAVEDGEDDPISNWWADTVSEGSEASRLAEEIKTEKSDKVIRKSRYSSFYETDLEEHLKVQDVSDLVITGVLTNLCCETAAREAFDRGFNVFSVMDGMATYSEEVHIASLKNLAYGFSTPLCTEDILS
jgi:isochorismate hydrolase